LVLFRTEYLETLKKMWTLLPSTFAHSCKVGVQLDDGWCPVAKPAVVPGGGCGLSGVPWGALVAPPLVVSVHIITYLDDIIKDIELVSNKIFESKKMDVVRLGGDVFALLHKFRMRQLNIHSIFPSPLFHLYVSR
jgi:hypothetical protein